MRSMPTCREASALASRAMDEHLPLMDRMGLAMHLAICRNCRRFTEQLGQMRRLFREETGEGETDGATGLSEEARRRIAAELQKRLEP